MFSKTIFETNFMNRFIKISLFNFVMFQNFKLQTMLNLLQFDRRFHYEYKYERFQNFLVHSFLLILFPRFRFSLVLRLNLPLPFDEVHLIVLSDRITVAAHRKTTETQIDGGDGQLERDLQRESRERI